MKNKHIRCTRIQSSHHWSLHKSKIVVKLQTTAQVKNKRHFFCLATVTKNRKKNKENKLEIEARLKLGWQVGVGARLTDKEVR